MLFPNFSSRASGVSPLSMMLTKLLSWELYFITITKYLLTLNLSVFVNNRCWQKIKRIDADIFKCFLSTCENDYLTFDMSINIHPLILHCICKSVILNSQYWSILAFLEWTPLHHWWNILLLCCWLSFANVLFLNSINIHKWLSLVFFAKSLTGLDVSVEVAS